MLDIFDDTSSTYFESYPEEFWNDQVNTWSFNCEKETFKWNMKVWQYANQTS